MHDPPHTCTMTQYNRTIDSWCDLKKKKATKNLYYCTCHSTFDHQVFIATGKQNIQKIFVPRICTQQIDY